MKTYLVLLVLILFGAASWGQAPQPADDPIAQNLFPPELVMRYSQEINLDEGQSRAIKEAIQKAQTKFLDMQWAMQSEGEKLVHLLKARPVDENAVLAQMDQVLNREREIKKAQISLLVRIKNLLTDAQQNKLMELRRKPSAQSQSPPIAFSACDANGVSQILLAEPDGGNQRVLTQGQNPSFFPAWSPDGSRLLFTRVSGGRPQLWVMNADGSEPRGLVAGGVSLAGSWSADGRRIAYAHSATQGLKIWIAQTDGSQARRLTDVGDPAVDENVPRWSPDGTQITFTSNRRGRYEIWVADVASGTAKPLTQAYSDPVLLANIEQKVPAWSPDGKLIAYWAGVEGNDPRPNLPRHVWVMNADGTDQRRLVGGDDPNWSPSGEFIIHSAGWNGRPALEVVRPDGSDARTLFTVNACGVLQSSWSNGQ